MPPIHFMYDTDFFVCFYTLGLIYEASEVEFIHSKVSPKQKVPKEQLVFGKSSTDHILTISWSQEKGWEKPLIKPYENISLDPAALVLHYALAVRYASPEFRCFTHRFRICWVQFTSNEVLTSAMFRSRFYFLSVSEGFRWGHAFSRRLSFDEGPPSFSISSLWLLLTLSVFRGYESV